MVGNSISQSDVRRNFDPLSSLAAELGFALLAVAHFGKSGEKAGDRLSGSHAFRDVARSLLVCAIDEDTMQRILTVEKSNYSPIQPSDAYDIESVTVTLDDGYQQSIGRAKLIGSSTVTVQEILDRERDLTKYSEDSQSFIAYVNKHPEGVKAEDVASLVNGDIPKARKYLNRAAGRGDIERRNRGVFGPVSRGMSGSSGMNTTHTGHITHTSSRDTCLVCGTELHPALIQAGESTHPGCEVAS
jgi:hypothetical protein